MQNQETGYGYLTVFGITSRKKEWVTNYLSETIGIQPSVITYPDNQSFFFFTNHGDLAETRETILLKFGFARSTERRMLSSKELLEQGFAAPDRVQSDRLTGNFLLVTFSKLESKFSACLSLFGVPQLYYAQWEGGILCSTSLRAMVNILQKVELDEECVPIVFLIRRLPGPKTFYRNISRLYLGELLTFNGNDYAVKQITDFSVLESKEYIQKIDPASMSALSKNITEIMGAYVNDIRGRGEKFMTMLSGGVDSSTMQLLVNRSLPTEEKPQSISYIIDAKSFQFEVDYARTASELLHTQHTFFEIPMREYADRLVEAIGILAQPNATPVISNKFILARHLKDKYPSIEYLFNGLCSDCLFGVDFYKSLSFRYGKILHYVPGYYTLMRTSTVTSLPSVKGSHLTAALKLLADRDTWSSLFIPAQLTSPFNKLEMADIIDLHRRVFGDRALLNVLNYRENILAKYSKGRNRMEQIQDADTIDAGYESAIHNYVFYQSQRKKLIYFYLDQEVFQLVRAFDPRIRYLEGKRTKPLIKNILLESSLDAITNKKKGGSGMNHYDLHRMMKEGALKELVRSIDRPSFMNKRDFDELMNSPEGKYTGFLWDLLNWDIFQKQLKGRIIKAKS